MVSDTGRVADTIVLIGMPGAGKSTVGVVLAKRLRLDFCDTDLLIQHHTGRRLPQLIDELGIDGFLALEDRIIAGLDQSGHVIATGGSAVFGTTGMARLGELGRIVHLRLPLDEIERRVGDLTDRGVAMRPGQTLAQLFAEREPLYERYADLAIDCDGLDLREVVMTIERACAEPAS